MKSIILIDDDLSILEIFKIIFERAGYEVTTFNDTTPLLNKNFEEPDIFIVDRHLNGKDGLEFCRFLKSRESGTETPVIVFSASPSVEELALEAGADDFIEKPFKSKDILALIEKNLEARI